MSVTKRTRFEVLKRDNYMCRYCRSTDNPLTIDHVIPSALGGSDDPSNLVAACKDCNAGKSSNSPDAELVAQVADDVVRWGRAMEMAAAKMRADLAAEHAYGDALDAAWSAWHYGPDQRPIPRPDGWRNSVATWWAAGVPQDVLVDAAQRALGNERIGLDATWRYFCGIVWNKLTELQNAARVTFSQTADDGPCAGHPDCECEALAYQKGQKEGETLTLRAWRESLSYVQSMALANVTDNDALRELNAVYG